MIGKVEKMIIFSLLCLLSMIIIVYLLFYFSGGYTITTYSISILIANPSDRFVKGVEQAALDYNVDVHMVTGSYSNSSFTQVNYLQRELENNADAVVIQTDYVNEVSAYLDSLNASPAIVTVGQTLEQSGLAVHVGPDNLEIATKLGSLLIDTVSEKECLLVYIKQDDDPSNMEILESLQQTLRLHQISYQTVLLENEEDRSTLSNYMKGQDPCALVTLEKSLLPLLCENARLNDEVFGVGFASNIRPYLESSQIKGLIVYSEYDIGYLSIRQAIEQIEDKKSTNKTVKLYIANAELMYETPLVQVLFPIG